jgi:hypothetical protein
VINRGVNILCLARFLRFIVNVLISLIQSVRSRRSAVSAPDFSGLLVGILRTVPV